MAVEHDEGAGVAGRAEGSGGAGAAGAAEGAGTAQGGDSAGRSLSTQASALRTSYPVAPGVRLNVRSGPGTGYRVVRVLPEGAAVQVYCQTPGTTVTGPYGTSNIWDNIGVGEFVSDAYVYTGRDGYVASRCAL